MVIVTDQGDHIGRRHEDESGDMEEVYDPLKGNMQHDLFFPFRSMLSGEGIH